MTHLEPFFPSSFPTPVDSTHSCSLQFNKPWYNIYIHRRKKKKKNIPGVRDVMHLEPRLNVIKKTPLLRGGSVAVCGGDGSGGGGHVVVLAAVVFIVVMRRGGWVLWR